MKKSQDHTIETKKRESVSIVERREREDVWVMFFELTNSLTTFQIMINEIL